MRLRTFGFGFGVILLLISGCGGAGTLPSSPAIVQAGDAALGEDSSLYLPPTADAPIFEDGFTENCQSAGCELDAQSAPVCGNSLMEENETCDDGNARPGDGCSGLCRLEPNFICSQPGEPCQQESICGDRRMTGEEACDDGNVTDGDGCSAKCQAETSPSCADGGAGCLDSNLGVCGDGTIHLGEICDDGNTTPGDGCSSSCRLEPGFSCPVPQKPCVRDDYCGDGRVSKGETCDDGNAVPGDGCTGACQQEPFFACPEPGKKCVFTIVCGDGKVIGDEACDDGNLLPGDGCSADCKTVEAGFSCPRVSGVGGGCTALPQDRCGDARLSYGETCDDGNVQAGDGCSASCRLEFGFQCPTLGQPCARAAVCGDGKVSFENGEQCDDGNTAATDGCGSLCQIEANFICPTAGQLCQATVQCGDRKVTGTEACDDGNLASGDGCSILCQLESGWSCPAGSVCRPARCGDGLRVGSEQCDDGNGVVGDGCNAQCRLETPGPTEADGWICTTAGQACSRTLCGNGLLEGSEQCDDGNNDTADGCTPYCRKEPMCPPTGGACATACGDGMLLPVDIASGQVCDDGNALSGDGCSSTCKIEAGYACTTSQTSQNPLILPIILRDFRGSNQSGSDATKPNHQDFEYSNGAETGIVENQLGTDGKPVHVSVDRNTTRNTATWKTDGSTDWFGLWYRDSEYSKTVRSTLTFAQTGSGVFQFSQPDTDASDDGFFPLDGLGWGNYTSTRNFHFSSEVRTWFEYKGGERLDFTGDDDVWVFINKKLAVDLGGVHSAENGSVILDANDGTGQVCDLVTTNCNNRRSVDLGLVKGSVYEIVVFQAERHVTRSSYTLTLSNFTSTRSTCQSVCGDAILTPDEACDLGTAKNTGAYGTCNANCTRPAYCGDAILSAPSEQCDDGANLTSYGGKNRACAPGCQWSPYCGDGTVNASYGEACDQGADNGKGYGFCASNCTLGPRCGDGATTDAEECDHGSQNGMPGDTCSASCTLKCGNGVVEGAEQCDSGKAQNTGGYGKCKADCTLGPRCGDGIPNGTEACDDGVNDGSYGACAKGCVLGPRCGDGAVQSVAGEICDQGAQNQSSPYGQNQCTTRCRPAPYCGDRAVDGTFGETCDDGENSGKPGSCSQDCKASVPLVSCGNGQIDPPEKCDDGINNGTLDSTCDTHCHIKCGNGFRDPGEACDDGINDGAYGTCNPSCTLAGYCGDGSKNGPEACDLGSANMANPYGLGKCTTFCSVAPYCGDGRIQSSFGEECEGGPQCDTLCKITIVP